MPSANQLANLVIYKQQQNCSFANQTSAMQNGQINGYILHTFCIHFVNYLPSSIAFSTFGLVFRSNELRKLLNWLLNTMQMILTLLLIVFIWLLVMITIRYSVKDLTNVGNKAYLLTQRGLPFQWRVFTYKLLEYIKKINSHDGTKREAGKLERILMTSRKKCA